ncbi:hypothetical protein [Nocardia sp. NPDC056000]|uniref:hypothetical protein n=1 Tax=Nocardia sp. NPDC056000 TaxID=3345674 RepID=UPI0035D8119D
MGTTGCWFVTALPDDSVQMFRQHFTDDQDPDTAEMQWWRGSGGEFPVAEPLGHWMVNSAEAERFSDLVMCDCGVELWEVLQDLPSIPAEHRFVVSASKSEPTAALCYGLGPKATDLLPGRFGDFLLTAQEVDAVLPNVEQALAITGPRRQSVVDRIEAWSAQMVDGGSFCTPELLLDSPLQLFRLAKQERLGLTAFSVSF